MKKFILSFFLLNFVFVSQNLFAKKHDDGPTLEKMQHAYKNAQTMTAEFSQLQKNVTLGSTKESSGKISIARPQKFLWQTESPEKSTLVGNGLRVWYYTPPFRPGEQGQVLIRKATDVQSALAIDLLSGQSDFKKDFKSKYLSAGHYELTPNKQAGDVSRIEVFLERPTNLVYKLVLITKTGNQTELNLKNVTLGASLPAHLFEFKIPPNTEEIE